MTPELKATLAKLTAITDGGAPWEIDEGEHVISVHTMANGRDAIRVWSGRNERCRYASIDILHLVEIALAAATMASRDEFEAVAHERNGLVETLEDFRTTFNARMASDKMAIELWRKAEPYLEIDFPTHADTCMFLMGELGAAKKANQEITAERDELQALFELQRSAYMRAVDRWRSEKPGRELILPDLADHTCWLLSEVERLELLLAATFSGERFTEVARLRARVDDLLKSNNAFEVDARASRERAQITSDITAGLLAALSTSTSPTHRHRKRNTLYRVLGEFSVQSAAPIVEGDIVIAYVGESGIGSARPKAEFDDGRFEELIIPPVSAAA